MAAAASTASRAILVTGGNSGIGLALCAQLLVNHNARVFMGTRDVSKGAAALKELDLPSEAASRCTVVQLDITSVASVAAAAAAVKAAAGGPLYAVVNNAGIGLAAKATPEHVLDTNLYGTKRVCEAFLPLLHPTTGRVVNVGSGAAGSYVGKLLTLDKEAARVMCKNEIEWRDIEAHVKAQLGGKADTMGAYGLSKAALAAYTQAFAKMHPNITTGCASPGFIDTKLTAGFGAKKSPAEGTLAIKKLLFEPLNGNGWYYGSDGVRSPYHYMRNPGEPEYDGTVPF